MTDDASATYRGYRRQALYALARILTDADSDQRVYHPEGSEDLAVFDLNQRPSGYEPTIEDYEE